MGIVATAILSVAGPAAAAPAPAAHVSVVKPQQSDYGEKIFSVSDTYFEADDSTGDFAAQVTYNSNGNPVAFSFVLSAGLQAIAITPMTCTAWQFLNGASTGRQDYHPNLPVNYLWHWSFPGNPIGDNMMVSGQCVFRVSVGGNTGTATASFVFRYVVGDGS
jgi:hypothetical protein